MPREHDARLQSRLPRALLQALALRPVAHHEEPAIGGQLAALDQPRKRLKQHAAALGFHQSPDERDVRRILRLFALRPRHPVIDYPKPTRRQIRLRRKLLRQMAADREVRVRRQAGIMSQMIVQP